MHSHWKPDLCAATLLVATATMLPEPAPAITVELARKCNALVEKQFPPRQPGNPAAGSAKGSGQDQRDLFKKCVDSGVKIDGAVEKTDK